jgi:hypothetical protein
MGSILFCALALLLAGRPAAAAQVQVEGTLRIEIGNAGPYGLDFPATGVAIVNGSGGGADLAALVLPAGLASGTASLTVTDPAAAPIRGVIGTLANEAGSFAATPGGHFVGAMPLPGVLRICLFAGCDAPVANLLVPLDPIGAGGTAVWADDKVSLTVVGAPWTTGTVVPVPTFPSLTVMGHRHGPVSATSSAALASGSVQLVTPILMRTTFSTVWTPGSAALTLHFAPEPGAAAPLAAAFALAGPGRSAPERGARARSRPGSRGRPRAVIALHCGERGTPPCSRGARGGPPWKTGPWLAARSSIRRCAPSSTACTPRRRASGYASPARCCSACCPAAPTAPARKSSGPRTSISRSGARRASSSTR